MEFINTVIDMASIYYTTAVRWVFLALSLFILARQIRSLLRARNPSEIWAYLGCPDDTSVPLTHWENLIGRSRGCDVILNLNSVSRSHGTLIRDSEGVWKYNDLNSKNKPKITKPERPKTLFLKENSQSMQQLILHCRVSSRLSLWQEQGPGAHPYEQGQDQDHGHAPLR